MNRLRKRFASAGGGFRKGLLPYVTAGYPDLETTVAILEALDGAHCACAELGIPFSDSIADGPVIQTSFSRALDAGFRLDALLDALHAGRARIAVPLVAMVSYSVVYRRGPAEFLRRAQRAGIDGVIVPDVSIEEANELATAGRDADCPVVLIAAPNSTPARRARIAALSEPFIYYQSVAGVTGERRSLAEDLAQNVAALRGAGKPVCVGFGISSAEQVQAVCRVADGAIVGSAIVRRMNDLVDRGAGRDEIVAVVNGLVAALARGVDG
ncbi:MAG: tryptophan synthase subunit alpha [Phycisphaerae bacterium]